MKCYRLTLLLSCFLLGTYVASAHAEEKWTLPNLNPFSSAKSSAPKKSNPLQLPKMNLRLPSFGDKTPKGPPKPSAWDKFTQGTKDLFDKTKDALTPGSKKSNDFEWKYDGFQTGGNKQEKPSFFSKMLPAKEEAPKRPRSPVDFLKQPRPQ